MATGRAGVPDPPTVFDPWHQVGLGTPFKGPILRLRRTVAAFGERAVMECLLYATICAKPSPNGSEGTGDGQAYRGLGKGEGLLRVEGGQFTLRKRSPEQRRPSPPDRKDVLGCLTREPQLDPLPC